MNPRFLVIALCVLGPLSCAALCANINGEATYISFAVPGASGSTFAQGINHSMQVTGSYFDSPVSMRGFLREPDGTISTFTVPGSTYTSAQAINDAGDITGYYIPGVPGYDAHGFLRYADGRFVTFEPSGVSYASTFPTSINNYDEVAGAYTGSTLSAAFTRSRDGAVLSITAPFGGLIGVTAINDNGSVVGYALIAAGTGFVAHPDGFWAEIAVPGDPKCVNQTIPQAINGSGTIAGSWATNYYGDPSCAPVNTGGFVLSPEGKLTLFSFPVGQQIYPEASHGFLSQNHFFSMNRMGDIVSSYDDANGYTHGFVRNPYGTITSFDPPESMQTFPNCINDTGVIAGDYFYKHSGGPTVAFIRVPR